MNKSVKRNVVISAILAIMLCVSLIAGATFALFTSESKVNIAVTSGKVDVVANVATDSIKTKRKGTNYELGNNHMYSGAAATFEDGELTVSNMVPGDGITFNIVIKNNSSISVKYRYVISCLSDNGLLSGLDVEIGTESDYNGSSIISNYATLEVNSADITVPVKIELPEDAGNEYQNKTLTLSYKVEATQGNADDPDEPDNDTYYVYTAMDLMNFNNDYSKIAIMNNIDMNGKNWTGLSGYDGYALETIIGNGYSISNLSAPLVVEAIGNLTIENLTIKDSVMSQISASGDSTKGFGAFLQLMHAGTVTLSKCHVDNVKMITEEDTRVGGLIGVAYANVNVSDCTVNKCELKAEGSIGGIIAQTGDSEPSVYTISNCSVTNSTLTSTDGRENNWKVGLIVGSANAGKTCINTCIYSGNTLTQSNNTNPDHELFGRIANGGQLYIDGAKYIANGVTFKDGAYLISNAKGLVYCAETYNRSDTTIGKSFKLTQNIDMTGIAWEPWCNGQQYFCGTFDGQNKTISNLTIHGEHDVEDGYAVGFIGRLGTDGNGTKTLCNVTFDCAEVTGNHYVGVAVGYNEFGTVKNVHVTNSKVTNTHANANQCGDKAGALIGMCGANNASYIVVKDCSATDCEVKGARDAGQLIGVAYSQNDISGLTATRVTVTAIEGCDCGQDRNGNDKAGTNITNDIFGIRY